MPGGRNEDRPWGSVSTRPLQTDLRISPLDATTALRHAVTFPRSSSGRPCQNVRSKSPQCSIFLPRYGLLISSPFCSQLASAIGQ